MPWKVGTSMSIRREFVALARNPGANIRDLCRRFGVSAKTGYKWLDRYREFGVAGLADQSRRPLHSPGRTADAVESAVLAVREKHSTWGGRKIRRWMNDHPSGLVIPSMSTITAILRRHGKLDPIESVKHQPWQHFEAAAPNAMWQIDFKGHFMMTAGRCHPLTILDDCTRFSTGVYACANEQRLTVQECLVQSFRQYGLPEVMLADNGAPWGSAVNRDRLTTLAAWMIRLGIRVSHSRPYHPQTKGKNERFNRTLNEEVITQRVFHDLQQCQSHFDQWRSMYNCERPHEALNLDVPASRYLPSAREYPEVLPPIEYDAQDIIRMVQPQGKIYYKNKAFIVGKGLYHQPVALRPTTADGVFDVFFCHQKITTIDVRLDDQTDAE